MIYEQLKPLYIFGAGGFGREVEWLVERINRISPTWDVRGYIDDDRELWETKNGKSKVCGGREYLESQKNDIWLVVAIGNTKVRRKIVDGLCSFQHIHFATLIDPGVTASDSVEIGEGSIICAGTIVTVDVSIGRHNIINLDCTVGHDAVLEDFVTLYPSVNISGAVCIGDTSEIGTGVQVIQGTMIGKGSVVGAGSVVIKSLEPDVTAVGIPAKVVKCHNYERFGGGTSPVEHKFSQAFLGCKIAA